MRAQALAMAIGQKMDELEKELHMAITRKVAEDFKDPFGPLNALTQAALAPLGEDGGDNFEPYLASFPGSSLGMRLLHINDMLLSSSLSSLSISLSFN